MTITSALSSSLTGSISSALQGGTGASADGPTIAATAGATIDALASSFDVPNENPVPVTVGTVAGSGGVGTLVHSLVGAQAVGFSINASTGAITLTADNLMRNAGAYNQWGLTRVFTVRVTDDNANTADCTYTVTLDTSSYQSAATPAGSRTWTIPGLDNTVGRTSANPLKTIPVDGVPSGWTLDTPTADKLLRPDASSATITDYDLRGYVLYIDKDSVAVSQCIMGAEGLAAAKIGTTMVQVAVVATIKPTFANISADLKGYSLYYGLDMMLQGANFVDSVIIECPNDCFDMVGGTVDNCYIHVAESNCYLSDGVSVNPITDQWGHSDGIQAWDLTSAVTVTNCYIDARDYHHQYWDEDIVIPAGGATFTQGSAVVSGSGTSWLTDLSVGKCVRYFATDGEKYTLIVGSIESDTQFTLTEVAPSNGGPGVSLKTFDLPLSGATAPTYFEGAQPTTNMAYPMLAQNNVLRGGGWQMRIGQYRVSVTGTITSDGSVDIVGSGTSFLTELSPGQRLRFSGDYSTEYIVDTVTNDTTAAMTATVAAGSGQSILTGGFALAMTKWLDNLCDGGYYGVALVSDLQTASLENTVGISDPTSLAAANVRPTPDAPVITVDAVGTTTIDISVPSDSNVGLWRASSDGGSSFVDFNDANGANTHQFTGLTSGVSYDIEVVGMNVLSQNETDYLQTGTAGTKTQATS